MCSDIDGFFLLLLLLVSCCSFFAMGYLDRQFGRCYFMGTEIGGSWGYMAPGELKWVTRDFIATSLALASLVEGGYY